MTTRSATCLLLLTLMAGPAGAQTPRAERLASPDALFYVDIIQPKAVLKNVADPGLQRAVADLPGVAEALKKPDVAGLPAVATYVAQLLGTDVPDAAARLLGGGVSLVVEGEKGPERAFVVVTPADAGFLGKAHETFLDLARKDAAGKGMPDPIKENEYQGTKVYSTSPAEAHAIAGGVLVVSNSADTLRMVLDRLAKPPTTSLADSADWKARRDSLPKDTVAWTYVNFAKLRQIDPATYAPEKPNPALAFIAGPWYESLLKADSASMALRWGDGKLGAEFTLPKPAAGRSKASETYIPPAGASAPPALKPPGVIASMTLWRDLSKVWDNRADIFPPETLAGLAQLDTTAGTFFAGRDFSTGVLGSLTSDWRLVVAQQDVKTLSPVPATKLPSFALVVGLRPEDEEFADRLMSAFTSFVGLVNIGAQQSKAPPLMPRVETFEGVTIQSSKFSAPRNVPKGEPVHQRHNFSPSAAIVDHQFILGSSLTLTRDLVHAVKNPGPAEPATLAMDVDGGKLAKLVEDNKAGLVADNMLKKGIAKPQAEAENASLARILRYLNRGHLQAVDGPDASRLRLDFNPEAKP